LLASLADCDYETESWTNMPVSVSENEIGFAILTVSPRANGGYEGVSVSGCCRICFLTGDLRARSLATSLYCRG